MQHYSTRSLESWSEHIPLNVYDVYENTSCPDNIGHVCNEYEKFHVHFFFFFFDTEYIT